MKTTIRILRSISRGYLFDLVFLGVAITSFAQTIPIVTIRATDPFASWSGDKGQFTLFRSGDPTQTLNVFCRIMGTATNGVDYQAISSYVQIPSGAYSNSVTIAPINNGQTMLKTVTLVLAASPLAPPVNYEIGYPSNATVYIRGGSNLPPVVRISSPGDNETFYSPANIPICATAYDLDGFVTTVEFFAGTTSLGIRTNNPMSAGPLNPFCLIWTNVPPGAYALTALATDNLGATTLSDPVNVTVLQGPPPTNLPPIVRISSPPNGATFRAPVNIPLYAFAWDPDGTVASVEFFADTNSLGMGRHLSPFPNATSPTNLFVLLWSNAPLGKYALTAVATDNLGATSISTPVTVTILPSPPPPTNRPPIVSLIASDPVAIEGTNCWPWVGLTDSSAGWSSWVPGTSVFRFFTNCGPKNAALMVHRFGETNDDLTVSYAIGGSATNGVDYVPLSGSVTIPAGERRAPIMVVPLDDGPPDITSTVILKLLTGTNYVLGFPQHAAALILDSRSPRPMTGMLPGQCFQLTSGGPDGAWFHIEYSSDLATWTPICTNQVVNGLIDFVDPDAQSDHARFYRAVPEPGPPAE